MNETIVQQIVNTKSEGLRYEPIRTEIAEKQQKKGIFQILELEDEKKMRDRKDYMPVSHTI